MAEYKVGDYVRIDSDKGLKMGGHIGKLLTCVGRILYVKFENEEPTLFYVDAFSPSPYKYNVGDRVVIARKPASTSPLYWANAMTELLTVTGVVTSRIIWLPSKIPVYDVLYNGSLWKYTEESLDFPDKEPEEHPKPVEDRIEIRVQKVKPIYTQKSVKLILSWEE